MDVALLNSKRFAGLDGLMNYVQSDLAVLNVQNALIWSINSS